MKDYSRRQVANMLLAFILRRLHNLFRTLADNKLLKLFEESRVELVDKYALLLDDINFQDVVRLSGKRYKCY